MKKSSVFILSCFNTIFLSAQTLAPRYTEHPDSIATHKVVLDNQSKLIPWSSPAGKAYDQFLRQRWNFIRSNVPNKIARPKMFAGEKRIIGASRCFDGFCVIRKKVYAPSRQPA